MQCSKFLWTWVAGRTIEKFRTGYLLTFDFKTFLQTSVLSQHSPCPKMYEIWFYFPWCVLFISIFIFIDLANWLFFLCNNRKSKIKNRLTSTQLKVIPLHRFYDFFDILLFSEHHIPSPYLFTNTQKDQDLSFESCGKRGCRGTWKYVGVELFSEVIWSSYDRLSGYILE